MPNYYLNFKCISTRCRHNCCIGWEIDIDPKTLAKYQAVSGPLGERLRSAIDFNGACFRLTSNEQCPFLNKDGLCDLILELGENALCNICADHPRFRNYFSNHIEIGLGLCCEEAARIILTDKTPFSLTAQPKSDQPIEQAFFEQRNHTFELLQNNKLTLSQRMEQFISDFGGKPIEKSIQDWTKIFLALERLDPHWASLLQQLSCENSLPELSPKWDDLSMRLLLYFVYRHLAGSLEDQRLGARATFCVLSVQFIRALATLLQKNQSLTKDTFIDLARLYSAEIEYSDENLEILFTLLT